MAKIGKNLIEMLLFSMYPDPKIIYREYVQNAFDAITKAVENKILGQTKDGLIDISISGTKRNIIIRDNGCGVSRDDISVLLDIANSTKDGISSAGVYGIGRLVGAGYCEKLIFRTSAVGENTKTIITLDSEQARKIIADKSNTSAANEVIDVISTKTSEPCPVDEHFFEVELSNVLAAYSSDLLNEDNVIEYLKDVAPIDYSTVFKKAIIAPSIEKQQDYSDFYKDIPFVTISVNDNSDIRKRYGLKVEGTAGKIGGEDDRILNLQFFTLEDKKYGILAKGWFAVTKFSVAINESNRSRGIRLRMHNIQIGNAQYLDSYHKEKRGNTYFYGEIHTINENLKPTTDRSALAPTEEAKALEKLIKDQFISLYHLYSTANKAKSKVSDIHTKVSNVAAATQEYDVDSDVNIITKNLSELEKIVQTGDKAPKSALTIVIDAYKDSAEEDLKSNPDVADKVAIQKRKIEQQSDSAQDGNSPTDQPKPYPIVDPEQTLLRDNSSNTPSRSITDIFAPLKDKYSTEEVKLIRKCYLYFSKYCPAQEKKDMMGVWAAAIKELEKDVR